MKAIQVRYLGPTNTKGTRWKAWAWGGASVTLSRDYALNGDQDAKRVAEALCDKMAWGPIKGSGQLPNGDYVFTLGLTLHKTGALPVIKMTREEALERQESQLAYYEPNFPGITAKIKAKTTADQLEPNTLYPVHVINKHIPRGVAIENALGL